MNFKAEKDERGKNIHKSFPSVRTAIVLQKKLIPKEILQNKIGKIMDYLKDNKYKKACFSAFLKYYEEAIVVLLVLLKVKAKTQNFS